MWKASNRCLTIYVESTAILCTPLLFKGRVIRGHLVWTVYISLGKFMYTSLQETHTIKSLRIRRQTLGFECLVLTFAQFKTCTSLGEMVLQLCQLSITFKKPITWSIPLKDKVLTWPPWLNQKSRLSCQCVGIFHFRNEMKCSITPDLFPHHKPAHLPWVLISFPDKTFSLS